MKVLVSTVRLFAALGLAATTGCFSNGAFQESATAGTPGAPLVLGHAGSGFITPLSPFNPLPPSSLGGVLHALELGADGVEVDIQLSQDSVPMLFHDRRLTPLTNGTGCISQHPAAELVQLRYQAGRPYDWFQHERPITFDTLLARLARRPTFPYLHLDLHEDDVCAPAGHGLDRVPALARQLGRSLRRYRVPPRRVLALSVHASTLRHLRAHLPGVDLGLEINENFEGGLRAASELGVQAVVLDADKVTTEQAAQARAAGLQVVVFGGRSTANIKRLLQCRPHAIEVDNVGRLLALLGREPGRPETPTEPTPQNSQRAAEDAQPASGAAR